MSEQTHGGKGSKQRPLDRATDRANFNDNWDKIFPPKEKEPRDLSNKEEVKC